MILFNKHNQIIYMQNLSKKTLLLLLLIVAVPTLSACNVQNKNTEQDNTSQGKVAEENQEQESRPVKEFSMTSFTEIIDGQYFPQFSTKKLEVNKGDLVRIKVTVTSGTHDFKIDEFDVYSETPLNEEVTIEFVADKAGEFVYYCTKPNHRANGHWGTLTVLE